MNRKKKEAKIGPFANTRQTSLTGLIVQQIGTTARCYANKSIKDLF